MPSEIEVDEPLMPSTPRRTFLSLLVLVHLLCFTGIGVWNSPKRPGQGWADAVIIAVFCAELGLLAVWAGLGKGRWLPRLAATWILSSLAALGITVRAWWDSGWMVFVTLLGMYSLIVPLMMVPIVVSLAVVRWLGWRLVLFSAGRPPVGEALQFSVRHILILTAVAAVLMSAAYYVRPLAVFEDNVLRSSELSAVTRVVVIGVLFLPFLVAPLLAVWACLGAGRPGLRLLIAASFSVALGLLPGYYFGGEVADYALFGGAAVLQLGIVAASLLVFRAVGYRLLRHPIGGDPAISVGNADG